jgi:hypothetical protein
MKEFWYKRMLNKDNTSDCKWDRHWMITTTMLKNNKHYLSAQKESKIDSIISLYEREMGSFEKATH